MTAPTGNPKGKPTLYNKEIAEEICIISAASPKSMGELCNENDHWPHLATIHLWRIKHQEFAEMYTESRRNKVETIVDNIFTILRDKSNDFYDAGDGKLTVNGAYLARMKEQVRFATWFASRVAPKMYGDKQHIEAQVTAHEKTIKDLD